jgi:glycosyltransferase involved in cell wall biosynthesis
VLIESMAAGLPVACSNMSAMPEILGDSGFYFNPLNVDSITDTLRICIESSRLREEKSRESFKLAQQYSWERCAHKTFGFLSLCSEA